ncbi:MAG: glutamate-5-semialdehyde dehydrogenase [Deltaproteobacteria bacterium]|jgi:glutamate-5-semialdehyde dehydrogenase|nr:glutamate-5-semialdehyde dehydrogenase [Deltaproteobacteria bacterium]
MPESLEAVGRAAKAASRVLAGLGAAEKNSLLLNLADLLEAERTALLAANAADMEEAKRSGLSPALRDRLHLSPERLFSMTGDLRRVAALEDPTGRVLDGRILDSGLRLVRRRTPLGVIAAIYEARPNVTVDIASLCLKTGNAVILRGGRETRRSNEALAGIIRGALRERKLPEESVQTLPGDDRKLLHALLRLDRYIDMLIPRGGPELQEFCRENSRIPVIAGGIGVCHIFVDKSARQDLALPVLANAKVQRPGVCNSVETALIHQDIAPDFVPALAACLGDKGVSLHHDAKAGSLLPGDCPCPFFPLEEGELDREWLSLDLNLVVVRDLDEAVEHINRHGSGHSDAILTESMENAERFIRLVDSAAVYVNASTRFTDGAQFGLGAEAAVSTQKLHARGPLALEALTTYKWTGYGAYSVRE